DLTVAARNRHAADRRRLHVVELLAPLLPRLPAARGPAAGTTERAGRTGPAATATCAWSCWRHPRPGTAAAGTAATRATWTAAGPAPPPRGRPPPPAPPPAGAGAGGAAIPAAARAPRTALAEWPRADRARRHAAGARSRATGPRAAWPGDVARAGPGTRPGPS